MAGGAGRVPQGGLDRVEVREGGASSHSYAAYSHIGNVPEAHILPLPLADLGLRQCLGFFQSLFHPVHALADGGVVAVTVNFIAAFAGSLVEAVGLVIRDHVKFQTLTGS